MRVKSVNSPAIPAIAMATPKDMASEEKCQSIEQAVQIAQLAAKLFSSCCFEICIPFIAIVPFPIVALSAAQFLVPGQARGAVPKNCVLPAGSAPSREGVLLSRRPRHAHGVYPYGRHGLSRPR